MVPMNLTIRSGTRAKARGLSKGHEKHGSKGEMPWRHRVKNLKINS